MSEPKSCVNCHKEVIGLYCHHCGQKQMVKKITWSSMFDDLQQRLFGFDSRFLRTVKDMTLRPEKVVSSFIGGVRISYVAPVGYYFLLLTVFIILIGLLDVEMVDYANNMSNIFGDQSETQQQVQQGMMQKIFGNFRLIAFLLIPWNVLAVKILYYKSRLNILETSIPVIYAQAHSMLFSIVAVFLFKYTGMDSAITYAALLSYTFFAYVFARFFKHNHPVWAFIKGYLSTLLGIIFFIIFIQIVFIAFLLIDPEGFKQLMGVG